MCSMWEFTGSGRGDRFHLNHHFHSISETSYIDETFVYQ